MRNDRIQILVAALFFTVIAGLLLIRRFDTVPEESVVIVSTSGSDRLVGDKFRRGEFIESKAGEYLAINIGDNIQIGIDERSPETTSPQRGQPPDRRGLRGPRGVF